VTLESVSFVLSLDLTQSQRAELVVEARFYGLLDRMMPYYAYEQIGVALLKRACVVGTFDALETAVSQARVLVFEMGSTTPWLTDEFQDLRYVITDRVVNDSPVWAAEGGEWFMYRDGMDDMTVGNETNCAGGECIMGLYHNSGRGSDVMSPTQLPSNDWRSNKETTLVPQFTSAAGGDEDTMFVGVPDMLVTVVHGLDDAAPAMAAALRQLAAL